jgi:hypothetical protein
MKITELLLAELEREAVGSRKTLENVPEGKNSWKPHEKSMTLGNLADCGDYSGMAGDDGEYGRAGY